MSVAIKICRRLSPRTFALAAIFLTILLCIYYTSYTSDVTRVSRDHSNEIGVNEGQSQSLFKNSFNPLGLNGEAKESMDYGVCPKLGASETDVNTLEIFKDFDFQVSELHSFSMTLHSTVFGA